MKIKQSAKRLHFALFGNSYQPKKSTAVNALMEYFRRHDCELSIDSDYYHFLTSEMGLHTEGADVFEGSDFEADYAVSLGGDGTLLHVAARVRDKNIPIVGVNMGRLGYLADFPPTQIEEDFDALCAGKCWLEKHSVINVQTDGEPLNDIPFALNDVAVLKRDNASMISIRVNVNGEYAGTYLADGLIVATPTGSTAYSLSNGGPIIGPGTHTLCLTPVASHSLNVRPIVVSDDSSIDIAVESRSHNYLVALDGRSQKLTERTSIHLKRAPYCIQIVKRPESHYFETLRKKLMWGLDQRS